MSIFFLFNDPATTEIYTYGHTLSRHDALPISTVASVLPAGVAAPHMSPLTSSTMDLLKFGLVSDRLDDFALRDLADFSLRPRLLAVPGVARVTVFGGAVRQLQVQINPQRLRASGLGMSELLAVMRRDRTSTRLNSSH